MQLSLLKERVTVTGKVTYFRVDACGKRGCNCHMSAYEIMERRNWKWILANAPLCMCVCVSQSWTLILSFIVLTPSPIFAPTHIVADNETPTADLCLHFYKQIFVKRLVIYTKSYFSSFHIKLACRKKAKLWHWNRRIVLILFPR